MTDASTDMTYRRQTDLPSSTSVMKFYVTCSILMCLVTVVAVIIVSIVVPNNTTIVATIIGLTTPISMGLLARGLQGMATAIDGKFSQLLVTTAQKERLAGLVDGLRENPQTNLTPTSKPS